MMNTSKQTAQNGRTIGAEANGGGLDEMARKHKPATIIRAPKDRENPYKAVRRATFEDKRLTWEARGVLGYLLVKPDTWEINVSDLWQAGDVGRNKIYRILAELEQAGYMERVEVREKGKFLGIRYLLHEEPLPENGETVEPSPLPENGETVEPSPLPENGDTATRVAPFPQKRDTVFGEHSNKEEISNKEQSSKEEELGIVGVPPTPPLDIEICASGANIDGWQDYLGALCWVCHGHQKTDALTEAQLGALSSEAKRIRADGYSQDDLRAWWMKVWRNDWRWDKGRQRPRPDEVRSSIPILRVPEADDDAARRKEYSMFNSFIAAPSSSPNVAGAATDQSASAAPSFDVSGSMSPRAKTSKGLPGGNEATP